MINSSNTDAELWRSFKEGDRESFTTIYYQYLKNLYEYGLRIVEDKNLVKDRIHDLFVKLWNNKLNLDEVRNVKVLLTCILTQYYLQ